MTEETARAIIAAPDVPKTALARRLGVTPDAVRDIRRGRTWRHLH